MSTKYKKGTIGYTVQKLVAKHGQNSSGIVALHMALEEASGKYPGNLSDAPRYLEIVAKEKAFWLEYEAKRAAGI